MNSRISIVKCNDYIERELLSAIRSSFDLLGGVSNFIKKDDKVLIKPNLLAASPPETGIDTHPEFVRAVIRIIKETKAEIYLGDGPGVWGSPQDVDAVYDKSGIKKVASDENIILVKFSKISMKSGYPFTDWIDKCNKIVNLPKFKTHGIMILTGAIKNLFGLIPGLCKTELHKKGLNAEDFSKVLVDIYSIVRPTISIVDGIVAMEADGPANGGKLRKLGLIIASCDAVALDSVLALIMGLNPQDILTTKEASSRKLGNMNLDAIEVSGEKIEDLIIDYFKLPQVSILNRIPKPLLNTAKGLLRFRIKIDNSKCKRCQLCVKGCPAQAMELKDNKIKVDYQRCVLCLCCIEICPESAVKIDKSIVARLVGI